MASNISLMVGNTSPPATDTIRLVDPTSSNGTPVDLTDASVKLKMRLQTSNALKVNSTATIVSELGGQVSYQWISTDVDTAGSYAAWFNITYGDGSVQDTPEFAVRILSHAPIDGYTTVASVRSYLNKDDNDSSTDEVIADLILRYSRAVDDYCQVSFTFEEAATKRFRFFGKTVSFSRYGLSSVTSVKLSPEDSNTTLTEDREFILMPLNKENGCYTSLMLSRYLVPSYQTYLAFGTMMVDVTGDWGCEVVPSAIEFATCKAVASDVIRNVALRTNALPDQDSQGSAPVLLPADVRAALQPYRRYGY